MRPTTTFNAYSAEHLRSAKGAPRKTFDAARAESGHTPIGAPPLGGEFQAAAAAKLSDLTAEQLERVSRFGVLPSYPNRMKKAVGASDLLSEGGPA